MNTVDKAFETQLKNIQTRTGKTLDQLFAIVRKSGLAKHGEILPVQNEGYRAKGGRCRVTRLGATGIR